MSVRSEDPAFSGDGRIRIGISSCLLGERVRWDGDHKRDGFIAETLAEHFEFVPVCPEVAIGLGVPRDPIRLVGRPDAPRAVTVQDSRQDVTGELADYGRRMARELDGICGYLFKSGSPSCGMERVKVYGGKGGRPAQSGMGIYARALLSALPLLPAEEEGRLNDPARRDSFIERVCAHQRWQALIGQGFTAARLAEFHNRHKLALLAHGAEPARALGRLAADAGKRKPAELARDYGAAFAAVLRRKATRRGHANVLHHALGYLKRVPSAGSGQAPSAGDVAELLEAIGRYRTGLLPLASPVTLLRHHFRHHPDPALEGQTYFNPHPAEAALRSGV